MRFSQRFYRATAICSFISVVTTLCLIFLPKVYGSPASFAERMALVENPFWQLRGWAYLVHPFITLTAALGVAVALRRIATNLIVPGFLAFTLWGFTEAGQQCLTFALFRRWATQYATADAAIRETIRANITFYDSLWDAMYLLILLAFFGASILYGLATIRQSGLTRVLGFFYFAAAFITLDFISGELNGPTIPATISFWLYPLLQPAARTLIGIWLWQRREDEPGDVEALKR
jgi:hypothetical protein